MASQFAEDDEMVEFDLAIEEDVPAHQLHYMGSASLRGRREAPRKEVMCQGSEVQLRTHPLHKQYRHSEVPRNVNLAAEYTRNNGARPVTTLMIRNIPNLYSQRDFVAELESLGFGGDTFDFLYLPLDKGTKASIGYAFVNFASEALAEQCMVAFQGYRFKKHRKTSGRIAAVSVAHIQGLEDNLRHYENAAVNNARNKQRRPIVMASISRAFVTPQ